MPVDPKKKWDVFVSYAHPDDLAIGPVNGWVSDFVKYLRNLLVQATGDRGLTVWQDSQMKASEKFDGAIADAISNSAVFLIVFSPSWRSSGYCLQELDWFNKAAGPAVSSGNLSRIVTARRGEVPFEQWPAEIKEQHEPVAFNDPAQPLIPLSVTDPAFLKQLGTLAEGIKSVLLAMKAQREANTAPDEIHNTVIPAAGGGTPLLYLGPAGALTAERDAIVRDLKQLCQEKGATIRVGQGPEEAITGASLSLHMFSASPDPAAEEDLKNALAVPLPFRPLVWLPKSVNIDDVDSKSQTKLLESLRDNGRPPGSPPGNTAEFFNADIEELKSELHRRLAPPRRRIPGRRRLIVYLSYKGSAPAVPQLQKLFDESGFHFFALDHATPNAAEIHNSTIENCDGFAVLYDPASLDWAEKTTHQALMTSWRTERPRALATFEIPPPARAFANSADTLVQIRWNPATAEKDIAPFLHVLEESNA